MKGFASTKPAMLLDAVSGAVAVAGSVVVPGVVFVAQAGVSERMLLKGCCLWWIINKASLVNPNVLSGDLLYLVGWINEMIKGAFQIRVQTCWYIAYPCHFKIKHLDQDTVFRDLADVDQWFNLSSKVLRQMSHATSEFAPWPVLAVQA